VDDWKEETRRDLVEAESRLSTLAQSISGEPGPDQLMSLWHSYVLIEKSVAFIKVELEDENPGLHVSMKPYKIPDERQAVAFALNHLRNGVRSIAAGDLKGSLKELRESRNYLRVLLRAKRTLRTKKARASLSR
jgi:hypothetical protein